MEFINLLAGAESICSDSGTRQIFEFVGKIVTAIKIIVPVILVIMGSIDLAKAVMAQKDDEIKKAYGTLIKRVIIGVVIFFLPGLISVVMGLVGGDTKTNTECYQIATGVKGSNIIGTNSKNPEVSFSCPENTILKDQTENSCNTYYNGCTIDICKQKEDGTWQCCEGDLE